MYNIDYRKTVEKQFHKLAKKNPARLKSILKKIEEISIDPHHYKNLRKPLQHLKRIHIDSSFVLVFSVDDNSRIITIEDYDHHDNIYKNKMKQDLRRGP
jgi:YafQ family addiction module toxin component